MMRWMPIALVLLAGAGVCAAQDDASAGEFTLQVHADMVPVTVLVHDAQNHLVRDLKQSDFRVVVDGKPTAIHYFDADSDLPLRIGLLVDTSGSLQDFIPEERSAAEELLKKNFKKPDDQAFVVRFDQSVVLLQPMTHDAKTLKKALDKVLFWNLDVPKAPGKTTLLWDAVAASLDEIVRRSAGRRTLIVMTDGMDEGSELTLEKAKSLAQFDNTQVYGLLIQSPNESAEGLARGLGEMTKLCDESGGRLYPIRAVADIKPAFQEIEMELRSQYRLGFDPAAAKPFTFHRVEVSVGKAGDVATARTGYYTPGGR